MGECIFCAIGKHAMESTMLYETDDVFVINANAELVYSRPWFFGVVQIPELYRIIRQVDGGFLVYQQDWIPAGPNQESLTISKVSLEGEVV